MTYRPVSPGPGSCNLGRHSRRSQMPYNIAVKVSCQSVQSNSLAQIIPSGILVGHKNRFRFAMRRRVCQIQTSGRSVPGCELFGMYSDSRITSQKEGTQTVAGVSVSRGIQVEQTADQPPPAPIIAVSEPISLIDGADWVDCP